MSEYNERAKAFLDRIGATVKIEFAHYGKHFFDDRDNRNVYRVAVERNNKRYTYMFGDSVHNTQNKIRPTEYDVLSCLTYGEWRDEWDFGNEFGYEVRDKLSYEAMRRAYFGCKKETAAIDRLFGDVLDEFFEVFN